MRIVIPTESKKVSTTSWETSIVRISLEYNSINIYCLKRLESTQNGNNSKQ